MSAIECAFFGALARDAELKTSKSGRSYLRLNVRGRVYVEGSASVSEWQGQTGVPRWGLQVLSWHTRLSQIGRNRVRERDKERYASPRRAPAGRLPASGNDFHDDEIPFAPEVR